MTITIDLPDKTLSALHTVAHAQGRPAESIAAERLIATFEPDPLFSTEGSEEELNAIGEALRDVEEGRTHLFDPEAILKKYGLSQQVR